LSSLAKPVTPPADSAETPLEALASLCIILAAFLFVSAFIFQNMMIPSGSMEKTLLIGDHLVVDRETLAPPTRWAPFVHYRPVHRGDVIVFMKPHTEAPDLILVKRAIALPGDHIHLRNGVVYLNGVAQNEPYARQPSPDQLIPYRDNFPADLAGLRSEASQDIAARGVCQNQSCLDWKFIDNRTITWTDELPGFMQNGDLVVPPGSVFAMGDNRTQSLDGRFWGFVPQANILGRPLVVFWSFKTPADDENKTSLADRLASTAHILLHFVTDTRWSRTLHVVR
jgi:signal peptidase I